MKYIELDPAGLLVSASDIYGELLYIKLIQRNEYPLMYCIKQKEYEGGRRDLGNESLLKPGICGLLANVVWVTIHSPFMEISFALFALPCLSSLITSFCE